MKAKIIATCFVATALSAMTASAHFLITVLCPNGNTASGIKVCATLTTDSSVVVCGETDDTGFFTTGPLTPGTYNVCVDLSTLPAGATLSQQCRTATVADNEVPVDFTLGGSFCETPAPPGFCWLTGGGTVGGKRKKPNFSFGGVVYPGCSPKAADGGNFNVVDHRTGIHFQGQHIVVDECLGVPTRSPRVTLNIIDFHGDGIVTGIAGNPQARVPVTFVGRAIDNHDGGAGSDELFLLVSGGFLQIGASADDPAVISTGNLQIHQSSCGK